MKYPSTGFETWFHHLRREVMKRTGVGFQDEDAVRFDYEEGKDVQEVIDDIVKEYGEIGPS